MQSPTNAAAENRHVPVLLEETLAAFDTPGALGVLVDCTLGGAGHTRALLSKYPQMKILACDMDDRAIAAARESLASEVKAGRLEFFHGNFTELVDKPDASFPPGFGPPWNGVLMDLGYSSNQLENPDYGMSFMVNGPVDMRLSRPPRGLTAWDMMLECTDQEFGDILKAYGEMPGAHRLARRIREGIQKGEIRNSTRSLADYIEKISGRREKDAIHPATLVFQSLRIAVNDELRALDHFLEGVILKVKSAGRVGVITFHSLEDRIVKRWGQGHGKELHMTTKKPQVASLEEMKSNPRSRSAKLRVYERRGLRQDGTYQ